MNEVLITIMLFCATLATVFACSAGVVFLFLLTREMIRDHFYD
jgi:hypothetical protein